MGFEDRIDVACGPPCIIGKSHGRSPDDVHVRRHATAGKSIAKPPEGLFDCRTIQHRRGLGHATSSSCGATNTPRRRKATGAWTIASTRAAGVLNGNQKRSRDLAWAHNGAAR